MAALGSSTLLLGLTLLAFMPRAAHAEIIWAGDYETGNFLQWHWRDDTTIPFYAGVPPHGRPPRGPEEPRTLPDDYYGDGSLLQIVTDPVRQGRYAARFEVRNSRNGAEPQDCDPGGNDCTRRRTELWANRMLPEMLNAMPYGSERWISISHYVPQDWEPGGSGWGPLVLQVKPYNDGGGVGPCFGIIIKDHGWELHHSWTDVEDLRSAVPWQQQAAYSSEFPSPHGGDYGEDLRADFPDQQVSQTALANLNKGGWTDWVIHLKFDARGSQSGGQGFLTVWKRAGDEDWIKVLQIEPRVISRAGVTFDRGVCYNSPARGSNPGGFGVLAGLYMRKGQVWDLSRNRVLYNDNIQVGSERATFEMMSPDGSVPGAAAPSRPRPPMLIQIQESGS